MACVALPAAAVAEPLAPASSSAVAANSVTFNDSTGEDPQGPDITTIVVSNNDAGIISFQINVPNRPQLTPDMAIILFVDSDSNASTGDPDNLGADYVIWASDYPHPEFHPEVVKELRETIAPLPDAAQRKILGENAIAAYELPL